MRNLVHNTIQLKACIKTELKRELSKLNSTLELMPKEIFDNAISKAGTLELSEVLQLMTSLKIAKDFNNNLDNTAIDKIKECVKKGAN